MISLNENKINQTEIRKKRIKNFKFFKNHKKKFKYSIYAIKKKK